MRGAAWKDARVMRRQILSAAVALFCVQSAAAAQPPRRSEPLPIAVTWAHPRKVDEQGRIWLNVAPQELWGVALPTGAICRSEQPGGHRVPCEEIVLPKIREVLAAHGGRWNTIMNAQHGPGYLFAEVTEYLVAQGWLLDLPSVSGGYYAAEMAQAKRARRGIWKLAVKPPVVAAETRNKKAKSMPDAPGVAMVVTRREMPLAQQVDWGKIESIDDAGRVTIGGKAQALWGVALPTGMSCEVRNARPVPCEQLALQQIGPLLQSHFAKWSTVRTTADAPPQFFTEMTERLVEQGWLLDVPDTSMGYYAVAAQAAKNAQRGIWGLRFAAGTERHEPMTDDERRIVTIAQRHNFITTRAKPPEGVTWTITDRVDSWEVSYDLPRTMIGGVPHIFVDKTTEQVVKTWQTQ